MNEWSVGTCPKCLLIHGLTLVGREAPIRNRAVWNAAWAHVDDMMHEGDHGAPYSPCGGSCRGECEDVYADAPVGPVTGWPLGGCRCPAAHHQPPCPFAVMA